jgi:hypothetical protein
MEMTIVFVAKRSSRVRASGDFCVADGIAGWESTPR